MYLILDISNLIIEIAKEIRYVKTQKNGVAVLCGIEDAETIYAQDSDTHYPVSAYHVAEVESTPNTVIPRYWYYINGEFSTTEEKREEYRAKVIETISADCKAAIEAGCDVTLADGTTEHFSLDETDQINISTALAAVTQGAAGFPYHADDKLCRMYSATDITAIANAAAAHKLYHTTYHNHLKIWAQRSKTIEELTAIYYGAVLPEDLATNMNAILEATGGTV